VAYAHLEHAQAHPASEAGSNKLLYAFDGVKSMGRGYGIQCDGQKYPYSDLWGRSWESGKVS